MDEVDPKSWGDDFWDRMKPATGWASPRLCVFFFDFNFFFLTMFVKKYQYKLSDLHQLCGF